MFVSTFDGTTYTFPAGAFTDTVVLRHTPIPSENVPSTGDLSGINHFFDVTAVYSSTGMPAQLVPGTVYTISVAYTEEEKGVVSQDSLHLYHWDGVWSTVGITKTVSGAANVLTSNVNHLSLFGVMGMQHRVYLPLVLRNS